MFKSSIRGSAAVVYIDIVAYYGQNVKVWFVKPHPRPLSKDMEREVRRRSDGLRGASIRDGESGWASQNRN